MNQRNNIFFISIKRGNIDVKSFVSMLSRVDDSLSNHSDSFLSVLEKRSPKASFDVRRQVFLPSTFSGLSGTPERLLPWFPRK